MADSGDDLVQFTQKSDDGLGVDPVPDGPNMRAFRALEERMIEKAVDANDHVKAGRLAKEALSDPALPLFDRAKFEFLLSTLPGYNSWDHMKKAREVIQIMEGYLEDDEAPNPIDVNCVKRLRAFFDGNKADLIAEGIPPPEDEDPEETSLADTTTVAQRGQVDREADLNRSRPNKRGIESDGEQRYVKKNKFAADETPTPEHPVASIEDDMDINMAQLETYERTDLSTDGHQGEEHIGTVDTTHGIAHGHGGTMRSTSDSCAHQEFKRPSSGGGKTLSRDRHLKQLDSLDAPGTPASTEHITTVAEQEEKEKEEEGEPDEQHDRTQGTRRPVMEPYTGRECKPSSSGGDNSQPGNLAVPNAPATAKSQLGNPRSFAEPVGAVAEDEEEEEDDS